MASEEASFLNDDGLDIRIRTSTPNRSNIFGIGGRQRSELRTGRAPRDSQIFLDRRDYDTASWLDPLLYFTGRYLLELLKSTLYVIRFPLSLFLGFLVLFSLTSGFIDAISDALRPICTAPIANTICSVVWRHGSNTPDPNPNKHKGSHSLAADFPSFLDLQNKAFNNLAYNVPVGLSLSEDLSRAERATIDLIALIKTNDLANKDIIIDALSDIVTNSKTAGTALSHLSARINHALDKTYHVNQYALRELRSSQDHKPTIFGFLRKANSVEVDGNLAVTFEKVMSFLASEMGEVLLHCDRAQVLLAAVDSNLIILHETLSRETASVIREQSDLAGLWTMLGGNRRQVYNLESHLRILGELSNYRADASKHVVTTARTIQTVTAELENLRAQVATPAIVENRIPIDVQLKAIETGLERLRVEKRRVQERYKGTEVST